MKRKFLNRKKIIGLSGVAAILLFIFCTQVDKGIIGVDQASPTIQLIQPPSDSVAVADSINKYQLKGAITLASGQSITTFTVNGTNYIDSVSTAPREFAVTVALTSDTNRFFLTITDSKNKTGLDTIVIYREKATISVNQAMLSGTMYRPSSSSLAKRLAKTALASNAAGQSSVVSSILPLSGADILLYNADSVTTSSITSTKTDSTGAWNVTTQPGNYFIFAVWFDQQNLELITTSIQNVKAEGGKADTVEDKVALVDDIQPMILTFLDAEAADNNNTFLANNISQGQPIVVTFSEPMNRVSVGGDTTGIILGEIDPKDENVALKSRIPLEKLWSATGKELRLVPKSPLTVGKYYKVLIPSTVKDMALNKTGSVYNGIFSVIARSELVPFAIKGASLQNGDTISPSKAIEIAFSQAIDGISLNKNATLSPSRNFFFEAKGNMARLCFPADSGFKSNTMYTLLINRGAKGLTGDTLDSAYTISFRIIKASDTTAIQSVKAQVVSFVSTTMEAYVAQDIERFAQSFHPLLEATDISTRDGLDQTKTQNLETFMQARRNDAAIQKKMAIEGVLFPKIYRKTIGSDTLLFKKLIGKSSIGMTTVGHYCFIEDVGTGGFRQPRVLDSTGANITTQARFSGDTLIVNNSTYIINIPFNLAFFTTDADQRDPSYFGKLQNEKTNIEMQLVTITTKSTYAVRSVDTTLLTSSSHSADALFDLVTTELQSNSTVPFTRVMAIKMTIINENNRLLVRSLVSRNIFENTNDLFIQNQTAILSNQNFNLDSMKVTGTKGIELYVPSQKAVKVTAPVTFKWSKVAGVKGYIIGLSNEISGGTSGLLIFANDTAITVGSSGNVTGGTVLTVDPSQLKIPIPRFTNRMTGFDSAKVYVWKVIGIADSTASAITNQLNVIADSDFRQAAQPGYFTLSSIMPDISNVVNNQTSGAGNQTNDYTDSDRDGFQDWLENALGTNKLDASSKPEMLIDSDKDGIADFFETMFKTNPEDSTSRLSDSNVNHIPDTLERKSTWDVRFTKDSDNDKWPDEIEIMLKTDPWNANSIPQSYAKGAAPTGSYSGKFLIQSDNKEYDIAISISIDSVGKASASLDSTSLEILRVGERSTLNFEFGEWVFFYKIIAGTNVNKYLKFRAIPRYQEIEGAVDMSDILNGGGPYVGRFRARIDGNVGSLTGGTNTQPGTVTLPPQDVIAMFSNPPTDAKVTSLQILKDPSTGRFAAKLSIAGMPELTSFEAIWQPQIFPMYIFKFNSDSGEIRIEGAIFKDAKTMYLCGPLFINMKQTHVFAIKDSLATATDPTIGLWKGYAKPSTISTTPNTTGPLAYVGTRTALETALTLTGKKAMTITDSTTIVIKEIWQEGIWKCNDSTGTTRFQILEKPGDPQNVYVGKDKNGSDVLIIRAEGTGTQSNGPVPYKGDITSIKSALTTSGGVVRVPLPGSLSFIDAQVDISTLRKVVNPKMNSDSLFQIRDKSDSTKNYVFMSDPVSGQLKIMDNKPLASEMNSGTQTQSKLVPYTGSITTIQTTLTASSYMVKVMTPTSTIPLDAQINITTLQSSTDPQKPGVTVYQIRDAGDTMKTYLFMADSASGQLKLQDNKPLVSIINSATQPQSKLVPYTGPITNIQTVLIASANFVKVLTPNNPSAVDAQVNSATLISFTDPQKPGITVYQVRDARDSIKTYIFMADSATGRLMLQDIKPLVSLGNAVTQPQSKLVPFTGSITTIQTALTASANSVKVMTSNSPTPFDAQVNSTTLQSFTDPQKPGITVYQVIDAMDPTITYMFMADSATGLLVLKDNKPLVSLVNTVTQPQSKLIPYIGPISIIETALTASANSVKVMSSPAPIDAQVNITTLQSFTDPQKPGVTVLQVKDAMDSLKTYIFMADSVTGQLKLQDNKPMVTVKITSQNFTIQPFQGTTATIDSVLAIFATLCGHNFLLASEFTGDQQRIMS